MKEDVQRVIATPLARRMAKAEGVDLTSLSGSGPGGRIKAVDVTTALTAAPKAAAIAPPSASPTAMGQPQVPSAVRAATARRVQAAKRDIPHFYLTKTVEVSALNRLRSDLNGAGSHDKITLTPMLARAAALALKAHPELNAIWLPEGILDLPTIGVGIVAETPQGLRIPVIDRADELALDDLAREANALIGRARAGTLSTQDVSGGVISISNVGMFGADTLTPIISPPQAMILGVGAESQLFRPDANGAPSLRREMTLTLAADHRLIDGAMAARYLATLAALLERPLALLRPHPRG